MGGRKLSRSEIERIPQMREDGMTYRAISKEMGVSESNVYWHCITLGAESPNISRPLGEYSGPMAIRRGARLVRRFTPDEDRRLIDLANEGLSTTEISRKIGRQWSSTHMRLAALARREARLEHPHG